MPQSALFEEASRYFALKWRWHLHEETFQQLDKDTWICKATTTFNAGQGEPEVTFYVLRDSYGQQCTFDEAALPVLLDWCLKMATKKGASHE